MTDQETAESIVYSTVDTPFTDHAHVTVDRITAALLAARQEGERMMQERAVAKAHSLRKSLMKWSLARPWMPGRDQYRRGHAQGADLVADAIAALPLSEGTR